MFDEMMETIAQFFTYSEKVIGQLYWESEVENENSDDQNG